MLDIKFVRENPEAVKENIRKNFQDEKLPLVDEVIALDAEVRAAQQEADDLRASKNKLSKQIGALMGKKKIDEAEKAVGEFVTSYKKYVLPDTTTDGVNKLMDLQQQQTKAIGLLANTVGVQLSEELSNLLKPQFDRFDKTLQDFGNMATRNQLDALQQVVNSFIAEMNKSLNGSFSQMAYTIDQAYQLQQQNAKQMEEILAHTGATAENLHEIEIQTTAIIGALETYTKDVREIQTEFHVLHSRNLAVHIPEISPQGDSRYNQSKSDQHQQSFRLILHNQPSLQHSDLCACKRTHLRKYITTFPNLKPKVQAKRHFSHFILQHSKNGHEILFIGFAKSILLCFLFCANIQMWFLILCNVTFILAFICSQY